MHQILAGMWVYVLLVAVPVRGAGCIAARRATAASSSITGCRPRKGLGLHHICYNEYINRRKLLSP